MKNLNSQKNKFKKIKNSFLFFKNKDLASKKFVFTLLNYS